MDNTVGARIRAARVKKGLSQAELAEKIGVSQAAIGQWERGQYLPRGRNINALNDVLGPEAVFKIGSDGRLIDVEVRPSEADETEKSDALPLGPGGTVPKSREEGDPYRWLSKGRRFKEEVASVLSAWKGKVEANSVLRGPNNRRWVIDIATDDTILLFANPGAFTDYPAGGNLELTIQATLWRLVLIRKFLGDAFNYVAVVSVPPRGPVEYDDGSRYLYHPLDYSVLEFAEDADSVGLHVALVSSPADVVTELIRIGLTRSPDQDETSKK